MNTTSDENKLMEGAYFEYRKACYNILYQHALQRNVIDFCKKGAKFADLMRELRVLPKREEACRLFLVALKRFGALDYDELTDSYVAGEGFKPEDVTLDKDLIAHAVGKNNIDSLIHSNSYKGIIDTLSEKQNNVAADFVADNIGLWDEFLQQPFYAYGRHRAVEHTATENGKVLDIACGPGYGLIELSESVGPGGQVIGIEFSHDFASEAIKRVSTYPNVHVAQTDVDKGMSFLRSSYFNGAMLIGAFHFLKQKMALFDNVYRVLDKGGKFCVGYAYMDLGTYDQEVMDLRFKLRQPPASPTNKEEFLSVAQEAGFKLLSTEATIGCFGWYLFEK